MARVSLSKSFRNKDFHVLTDKSLAGVSKEPLHLRVDRSNPPVRIGYDDSIRRSFEKLLE